MAALMRWVGPAFIVLGMIYGAVYLVETDMFGPPERLVAGIAVTFGFGWLGQYFIRRGQRLLGELVTGTFFAGAFLCSWAVPAVTGWPVGTSILLSGAVGLLALAYSWKRADSTTFAIGVVGLAGIPISGPLYSDHRFVDTVRDVYGEQQMIVPLVLFAGLALVLRVAKGWFLPWALSIAALFISYTITSTSPTGFVAMASFIAAAALFGVVRGEVDDASPVQKLLDPVFRLVDAGAPLFALAPIWMLADELDWSTLTERLVMGAWAALTIGLAFTSYRGVESWEIAANPGRRIGALLSAVFAGLIAIGNLIWYVYVTVLAAAFLVSVVAGSPRASTSDDRQNGDNSGGASGDRMTATLVDVIQAVLGTATALGLLLIIMTGLDGPLTDDVPMLLSAWSGVALFAAAFYVRPELRAVWGAPFAFALGLLAASLGGDPVTLLVTSAVWLLAGFAVVRFGLSRRQRTPLMIGLTTMAIAVAKFLLVDTPHFEGNLMRAVSFLVAGLVIVLVSADSNDIRAVLRSTGSDDGE